MIEFLNPAALTALVAAGLPILLHLLKREKTRKVEFSAVRFLKELEQKRIKQVRLYQYLIILLRTLFIIFLVLTFARPSVSEGPLAGLGSGASTTVIVIDDSYSMQSYHTISTSFDKAKSSALEIMEQFEDSENFFVLRTSDARPFRGKEAQNLLAEWQASNEKTSIKNTLVTADSIFNYYKNPVNRLFIISDFTFPVSDSLPETVANYKFAVNMHTSEPLNLGIDSAFVTSRLIERDKPVQLEVIVSNKGNTEMESALALRDSNKTYALDYIENAPTTSEKYALSFSATRYGPLFLSLELDEDDLSLDNRYFLYRNVPASLTVLAISDSLPAEIRQALDILDEKTVLDITLRGSRLWQAEGLSDYEVVLIYGVENLTGQDFNRIAEHTRRSNGVVVIPTLRTKEKHFSTLAQNLGAKQIRAEQKMAGATSFFSLQGDKRTSPFYKELFRNLEGPVETPVYKSYFRFDGDIQPLFRFNNGDLFLGNLKANPNIYLFAADISSGNSNTMLSGLFLPLLYRVIYSSGYSSGNTLQVQCGQHVYVEPAGLSPSGEYLLIPPGGNKENLIPEQYGAGFRFDLGRLNDPGFYKIVDKNNKLVFVVTVNSAAGEVNDNVLSNNYFNYFQVIDPEDKQGARQMFANTGKTSLWPVFLVLALLALLLEMWLIYKLEGKQKPAYE